jgi:mannose-6-phosphate isomerase-like protein (cupin superfamily)
VTSLRCSPALASAYEDNRWPVDAPDAIDGFALRDGAAQFLSSRRSCSSRVAPIPRSPPQTDVGCAAADDENGLHAHPNEDHTFVVLQGEATFYGPNGESRTIGKNEGVLLPHGTFYWFKATSEEPLVMVRIGAAAFDSVDRHGRIAPDGSEMRGDSVENKQVELIMSDCWFR